MKRIFAILETIVMAALCLLLSGCVKSKFKMEFRLPADVNSTYRISYYASSKKQSMQIESAVAVSQGKCDVEGVTYYPAVVSVYTGQSMLPATVFYAERGDDIVLEGKSSDPLEWSVGGNKVNDRLTEWRMDNKALIGEAIRIAGSSWHGDFQAGKKAARALNAALSRYVEAHADDVAAGILFYSYFDAEADFAGFKRLNSLLQDSGVAEKLPGLTARQDIMSDSRGVADYGRVKAQDMIVQSYWRNIDTLRLAGTSAPVLVYFWNTDDDGRESMVDSLKKIAAWRGDSLSMRMADVALTADSVSWSYTVNRDSLRQTLRAIATHGLADADVMRLGVRSTPWFVVSAGKGKVVYSGPDSDEAFRKFRKLKKK